MPRLICNQRKREGLQDVSETCYYVWFGDKRSGWQREVAEWNLLRVQRKDTGYTGR